MARGDLLEILKSGDVLLERTPAGARPSAGDRIGHLDDHRLDRLRLDLAVVGLDRVRDRLRLAMAPGDPAADERVRALDLVDTALPMS